MDTETMPAVEFLPVGALVPNDWNPNRMSDAEFDELLAEVRHLGRLPKPVVVRRDGDSYSIVDGEHGWRAASEVGLLEVPCEVVEVDDFEAMRQTYKRNQHGTHDPVVLGQMFRRMLDERGLSNRALAEEIAVSEGTIRNHLLYADAAALRNDYAFGRLTIRQVRQYLDLPAPIGDAWLDGGADVDRLRSYLTASVRCPGRRRETYRYWDEPVDSGCAARQLLDLGLGELFTGGKGFQMAMHAAISLLAWRDALHPHLGGETMAHLDPVVNVVRSWTASAEDCLQFLPLRERPRTMRLSCPIPPERWAEVLADARAADGGLSFGRIKAGVKLALRELDAWNEDESGEERNPENRLALAEAPEFIRDADMWFREKVELATLDAKAWKPSEDELLDAKREAVSVLEDKKRKLADDPEHPDRYKLWELSPSRIVDAHFKKLRAEQDLARRRGVFESRETLVDAIVVEMRDRKRSGLWGLRKRLFTEADAEKYGETLNGKPIAVGDKVTERFSKATKDGRDGLDVLAERLSALPWPELVLIGCLTTGEGEPGESWLLAVDEREPISKRRGDHSLRRKEEFDEAIASFRRMGV